MHVLAPLHLHAAEGSIRLRQRSALVLAPCGGRESDELQAPSGDACELDRLPRAGRALGASVVVSSAASVSVGEGAAIRFMPGIRSSRCGAEQGAALPPSEQGASEDTALGIGLLAGERLLLHGVLTLDAAPSDCFPAFIRKTPLLLYGGREVSVRGEQQLDRLIILSQGTATLAGECTVGGPHRCSAERMPLTMRGLSDSRGPRKRSTVCSALEAYAAAHVAPQLQAAADADEPLLMPIRGGLQSEGGAAASSPTGDASTLDGTASGGLRAPPNGAGAGDSSSTRLPFEGASSSEGAAQIQTEVTPREEGWIVRALRVFRAIVSEDQRQNARARQPPVAPEQPQAMPLLPVRKLLPGEVSASFRLRRCGEPSSSEEEGVPLDIPGRVDALEALGAPRTVMDLRRKHRRPWGGSPPLFGLGPGALSPFWGPPASYLLSRRFRPASASPSPGKTDVEFNAPSPAQGPPQQVLWGAASSGLVPVWTADDPFSLALSHFTAKETPPFKDMEQASFAPPHHLQGFLPAAAPPAEGLGPVYGAGRGAATSEVGTGWPLLQLTASLWRDMDAAVFASDGFVLERGSSLIGGAVLLCGGKGKAVLQGTVDASRRGCQPTHGEFWGRLIGH